jgi:type I restriction enzyme M protein
MTDVVQKLWGFCNILRHDGIDYGDYIEQLTYLLFLKMAEEKNLPIPAKYSWSSLKNRSGNELAEHYVDTLRNFGKEKGILGEIFTEALSRFNNPVNLKKLIGLIDEVDWTSLGVDIKAHAYEGLLEKAASEGKKGAGQYFTPRILIDSIVRVMKPDPRKKKDFTIYDPAAGTGGFLIEAYEWLIEDTKGAIPREMVDRITKHTYSGTELVRRPKVLALMNLYLHGLESEINQADSIYDPWSGKQYDCILTNPPFGTQGANQTPVRDDFTIATSNKQLNFVQHVLTILKPGGRAAIVVPDSVLFEEKAAEIFEILTKDCDLHTVLRLPNGTFSPYSQGIKANVIFFTKGIPTKTVWIYDARTNVPSVTKKERPLEQKYFKEFEKCYGDNPFGRSNRTEMDRFKPFSLEEIRDRGYHLDIRWLESDKIEDDSTFDSEALLEGIKEGEHEIHLQIEKIQEVLNTIEEATLKSKKMSIKDISIDIQPGFAEGNKTVEGGVRQLRMNNITEDFRMDLSLIRTVTADKDKITKYSLRNGDIVFNNTNSTKLIGKSALFDLQGTYLFSNHITRIRPNTSLVDSNWVVLCLYYLYQQRYFERICKSWVNQSAISKDKLLTIEIPIPSLDTQKKIVKKFNDISRSIAIIKDRQIKKEQALKLLSQSLLNKAFKEGL